LLMTNGADLSAGPESPLLAMVDYPDLVAAEDMARMVLGNASDPNAKRKDGSGCLHLGAARGNGVGWKVVVQRCADVRARDGAGRTPIQVAKGDAIAVLRDEAKIERVYFGRRYAQDLRGNKVVRDDRNGLPQELINQFVLVSHNNADKVKSMLKET